MIDCRASFWPSDIPLAPRFHRFTARSISCPRGGTLGPGQDRQLRPKTLPSCRLPVVKLLTSAHRGGADNQIQEICQTPWGENLPVSIRKQSEADQSRTAQSCLDCSLGGFVVDSRDTEVFSIPQVHSGLIPNLDTYREACKCFCSFSDLSIFGLPR